jgi:putative transposase
MRSPQYRQLASQLQERTTTVLQQCLRPAAFSARCSAWWLLSCLVLAAIRRLSLSAVAAVRRGGPGRETLRQAARATLPPYDALRRGTPALLRATLPRGLRKHPGRRRYPLILDLHRVPYYKRGRTPPEHVRKGQRLPGTRYAHDYATISLLRKGQYYVVALTPFDPGDDYATLARRLLRQAAALGFRPRYVLLDRSFWTVAVLRYLYRARVPFVMPVAARGKKPTTPGGPTGTYVFLHGCRSGRYRYRLRQGRRHSATVEVVVLRRRPADRTGRRTWAYAVWRVDYAQLAWVRQCYRRRFRIESSYRLLETGRGRTSSRDEGLRLWYVVLAVVLLNGWLTLRREAARQWGRGEAGQAWYLQLGVVLEQLLLESGGPPASGGATEVPASPGFLAKHGHT